VEASDTWS